MSTTSTHEHALPVSTSDRADNERHTSLQGYLTDLEYPLDDIRTHLNDEQLTEADTRQLFGSIRKSVLDMIWQHKHLEIRTFRCTRLGCDYAQAVDEELATGTPSRNSFYRQQDVRLQVRGGTRYEVAEMILQHVGVYREAVQGVQRLQSTKQRILEERG
jgi:hypothetical protein